MLIPNIYTLYKKKVIFMVFTYTVMFVDSDFGTYLKQTKKRRV